MAHRGRGWPQLRQTAMAPTEGKPTVGDDEDLTHDGPRSSRYVSDAAGSTMMRPANIEVARQQREEALIAFSKTTPVVAARPWGGTNAEEDPARCAQVSALRFREAATPLAEAAPKQQLVLEAELGDAEEFAEHHAKAERAASVSADDLRQVKLEEATVAPLLKWLTSHSATWAMGRVATGELQDGDSSRQSSERAS